MAAANMPPAEHPIDLELARGLLRDQHPELASLALRPLGFGWDNVLFRLGLALVVRLPRRAFAAPLLEQELRWLPVLAPRLPLPVPVPVRAGRPALGYPWHWCVTPWFPGQTAAATPPADPAATAELLGRFLAALHQPAPPEAPANPVRGVPLSARAPLVSEHLERLRGELGPLACAELAARFRDLSATDAWSGPPCWIHGDLHPANMLVHEGALSAVLDFGDLCAGDPATDFAVAWMLLPVAARDRLQHAAGRGGDIATWRRAQAWAIVLGLAALAGSADHALVAGMGRRTLDHVLADKTA